MDDDMYDESRAICRFEISGVFAFFPSIFCIFSGFLYVFWFLIFGETEKPVLTKKKKKTIFFLLYWKTTPAYCTSYNPGQKYWGNTWK